MKASDFDEYAEAACCLSISVLCKKAAEYAEDNDRLANFKQAAGAQGISPEQALVGMMAKHFVSVAKMSKCPEMYDEETWDEKLVDLRNYTILLGGLIKERLLHG